VSETNEDLEPVKKDEDTQSEAVTEPEKPKRFVEKGPHVLMDTKTSMYWMKKDSWQDKGKFFNWHESRDYADTKNLRKIGGFDDWRVPTPDEAATMYDPSFENPAKGGVAIGIDTAFPEGAFKSTWVMADTSTRRPRYDFSQGTIVHVDEYAFGSVRVCRKDKVGKGGRVKDKR
jgi:hypothetical protein